MYVFIMYYLIDLLKEINIILLKILINFYVIGNLFMKKVF